MSEGPRLLVFTTLFPHPGQPHAGLFIRERMFRVAAHCPLTVVAPVPWFPLQGLIRRFRPHYRPSAPRHEIQQGIEVYHPRFLALPGIGRRFDGLMLALGSRRLLRRLDRQGRVDLVDAHFGYPDGYAAVRLGRWLRRPVTLTLRGTEPRHSRTPGLRPRLLQALRGASHVISVSDSLRRVAIGLGVSPDKATVVGNGVDTDRFQPVDRDEARRRLGLPAQAQVLVTVGGLCERKGFHRVIEQLPQLRERFPGLRYLVVGGPSAEGDWSDRLRAQVATLGLEAQVQFLGSLPPEQLKGVLSAADVFVLATRNEGWANVILEAMACGLPVVATDVGGNAEVVNAPELGRIVPFGDGEALRAALAAALEHDWDRQAIIDYARANRWETRVEALLGIYARVLGKV
ncbi:glycosyl transferase family 1 [Thiohalobacter sp. COW1]|uniref:glycosyltransferase n=1 Tax=Thiohalobacter sp. COW1 TaxID=2795687 RepID=UPI001915BE33|nr:glycosyltransferase [Thiohalobacter sp. COW1]BCO30238.1 glycosyl transferase family 1 [Thiohalobacter sp. COW1]